MKTDKQIYRLFAAHPEWFFELTQLKSPGECTFRSVVLKELEVRADGVFEPLAAEQPLTIVEFQSQWDSQIYLRLVMEMVIIQRGNPKRLVQGVIIFADRSIDPKTEPWTKLICTFTLPEVLQELEKRHPDHPLVLVCRPLTEFNLKTLEKRSAEWYTKLSANQLDKGTQQALEEVFLSWLLQRFEGRSRKEIEEMLLGSLPDLTETRAGKELMQEGKEQGKIEGKIEGKKEGKKEGKRESLLLLLNVRFGELSVETRKAVARVQSIQKLNDLIRRAITVRSIDELKIGK
jgi:predicted transposase YdaD